MRELSALIHDGNDRRMARADGKLGAAVEAVDDCARALASVLNDDYHHGLAQDAQDHVVRIYERAISRISRASASARMVEERLGAGIAQPVQASKPTPSTQLINGPRLDGASGHASQLDIDAMFA